MDTIFFILSKIVQFCIEPLNWALIFVIFGLLFLLLRKPHLCKRFLVLALVDLLVVGWLPASEIFLRSLENLVPKTSLASLSERDLGGIIILGGAIEGGQIALDRSEVSIHSSAERVTKAFELIRRYPGKPFIFSGFSGRVNPRGMSEADAFKQLIQEQGLSIATSNTAHYENQSRNTHENAIYSKKIIDTIYQQSPDQQSKPWLLVTSASHMYRSVKIFQKQDIDVIPVPVDYQTGNSLNWATFDLEDGAHNWSNLIHEVIGIFAYWITGKI
mgnify:CR=1 FL=1